MGIRRVVVIVVWALTVVAAAQWGARAQSVPDMILSGENIGFKPVSERDGMILGTIQIKVNGTWRGVVVVDAGPPKPAVRPLPLD